MTFDEHILEIQHSLAFAISDLEMALKRATQSGSHGEYLLLRNWLGDMRRLHYEVEELVALRKNKA